MAEPYRQSLEEVLEELESSAEKGLSAAEVQRRLDKYGPNRLRKAQAVTVTIPFLTFGFARLWHVFNMRSSTSPVFINEVTTTPFVWVSILLGIFLLLASVYLPVLSGVLSLHPPDVNGWALILTFSLIPLVIVQVVKRAGLWWEGVAQD